MYQPGGWGREYEKIIYRRCLNVTRSPVRRPRCCSRQNDGKGYNLEESSVEQITSQTRAPAVVLGWLMYPAGRDVSGLSEVGLCPRKCGRVQVSRSRRMCPRRARKSRPHGQMASTRVLGSATRHGGTHGRPELGLDRDTVYSWFHQCTLRDAVITSKLLQVLPVFIFFLQFTHYK